MTRSSFFPFQSEQAKAEFTTFCLEKAKAWPVPSETWTIETASGHTFVRASGRPSDPPLVLLPGVRASSLMWIHNIAALSTHYRTYALDTLGDVGFSVNRNDITKPEDLVNWLDEVLTVLVPHGPLSLMGISYGGWLASQFALRFPARLRGVVLLAPACTVLPTSWGFVVRLSLFSLRVGHMFERTLRWLFRDALRGEGACRAQAEEAIDSVVMMGRLFNLPRPPMPTVIDDPAWQNFQAPCIFLVGENEKIYSARAAIKRLKRVAPQVKAEIIPSCGHDLTMVQPEMVFKKALAFLDEHAETMPTAA